MYPRLLLLFLSIWLLLVPTRVQAEIPCGAVPRTQLILEAFQPEIGLLGTFLYGETAPDNELGHTTKSGYGSNNIWLLVTRARFPLEHGFELGFTGGVGLMHLNFEEVPTTGVYHVGAGVYYWIAEGPVAVGLRADATPAFRHLGRFSYGQSLEARLELFEAVRLTVGVGPSTMRGNHVEDFGYRSMTGHAELTALLGEWRIEQR